MSIPYRNSPKWTREQHKKYEDWVGTVRRQAGVELTNDQFCQFLDDNDGWSRRGRTREHYCITRIDYEKPFRLDNIQFTKLGESRSRYRHWKLGRGYIF